MSSRWDEIEKWLRTQSSQINWDAMKDSNWLNEMVSTFISPPNTATRTKSQLNPNVEIREGKDVIELVYKLPEGYEAEEVLLFVREDCVRIEGLPYDTIEMIKLPKLVNAKICKAKIDKDLLTIRLKKRMKPTRFHSHSISI